MTKIISVTSKYIRIAPSKIDKIISQIRGKTYTEALRILKVIPQKSSVKIWKTLKSAASNASTNFDFTKEKLIICEAFVNQASILKRVQPRARGKAYRIEKKFSHITISVLQQET